MSAVAVMRALLLAHVPLTNLVGSRISAGTVPLASIPAVSVREVSRVERTTLANDSALAMVTARIQVTVYAADYTQQKALLLAAKLGAGVHAGVIAGVTVLSVTRDMVGPDMSDEDGVIFEQSRDFKVSYLEPN